jgi:20S proteasome subunit beta 1
MFEQKGPMMTESSNAGHSLFPKALEQPNSAPKATGEVSLGTSIMAVSFNGGVVMGADSRTSTGQYVANRVSDKLSQVHERIYCCRSGSAADTQAVSDMVQYYLSLHSLEKGDLPEVKTAASLFQDICYQNKDRLMAGIIVGGWDKKNGGTVWNIPLGGSLVKQAYSIGGSGSTYIYAYCDAFYKPNLEKKQCQSFVTHALAHAMARDGSSGGVIRLVTITEAGCERDYIPYDKLPYKAEDNPE